jgi:hypothetical protein
MLFVQLISMVIINSNGEMHEAERRSFIENLRHGSTDRGENVGFFSSRSDASSGSWRRSLRREGMPRSPPETTSSNVLKSGEGKTQRRGAPRHEDVGRPDRLIPDDSSMHPGLLLGHIF